MSGDKVLAIDQSTTGTTGLLFDSSGRVLSRAYREVAQCYPQPGWVEHDPQELLDTSLAVAREAQERAGIGLDGIAAARHYHPARNDHRLGARERPAGVERHRLAVPADGGAP